MTDQLRLTQEAFDELLSWLDTNREEAGLKYKTIHDGLVLVFRRRGCSKAEEAADEVINRVALKVRDLKNTYEGPPQRYFYGVAKKVFLEYERNELKFVPLSGEEEDVASPDLPNELVFDCLAACKQKLTSVQRKTVESYIRHHKPDQRTKLAKHLGITLETLRVRVFRILATLRRCVDDCLTRGAVK
jgi:DNA-directed RNA polymerase specialized sigma24 family protein